MIILYNLKYKWLAYTVREMYYNLNEALKYLIKLLDLRKDKVNFLHFMVTY